MVWAGAGYGWVGECGLVWAFRVGFGFGYGLKVGLGWAGLLPNHGTIFLHLCVRITTKLRARASSSPQTQASEGP